VKQKKHLGGHFVVVFLAFVVLGLVSSVFRQEIGWKNVPEMCRVS